MEFPPSLLCLSGEDSELSHQIVSDGPLDFVSLRYVHIFPLGVGLDVPNFLLRQQSSLGFRFCKCDPNLAPFGSLALLREEVSHLEASVAPRERREKVVKAKDRILHLIIASRQSEFSFWLFRVRFQTSRPTFSFLGLSPAVNSIQVAESIVGIKGLVDHVS